MAARSLVLALALSAAPLAAGAQTTPPAASAGATIVQDGAPSPSAPPVAAPAPLWATLDPAAPLASGLIDLEVVNDEDRRVGEIEDLALEGSGRVRAVVIAVGSRLGGAAKHVAVDPAALRLSRGEDGRWRAVMTVTADALKAAPSVPYKSGWNND
jgi:hypothetical protein